MQEKFTSARQVSEHLLECTGQALFNGEFETFCQYCLFPQTIQTFEGQRWIANAQEFEPIFKGVHAHLKKNGVTEMDRYCIEAEYRDEVTIETAHESRLVSRGVLVQAPYATYSVLKFNGTLWQIASSTYAIADRPDHNAALLAGGS